MKQNSFAQVVGWKLDNPAGLRTFSDRAYGARMAPGVPLVEVAGTFVLWPTELGPMPDDATLEKWGQEYDVAQANPTAAIEAEIDEAKTVAALRDILKKFVRGELKGV